MSDFYAQNPSDHTAFSLDHEEQYGYDPTRDYLTSASYDGGSTSTTWSYDAAGNRNDASVVDNLNRATTISGVSRTYDILGNTTAIGSSKSMSWDALNRMTSLTASSATWDYTYRADGMRVKKSKSSGLITTAYRYDGQMPIEEYNDGAGWPRTFLQVIRYGLGARGIDFIQRVTNTNVVTTGYPLYDTHGNNVATLMRSGSSYSVGDLRSYDAWGGIRTGNSTGEPNPRHCANLGHLQDDESGFVYMRARYYEPGSGRFVSEDPASEGGNWFTYCENDGVNGADYSGKRRLTLGSLSGLLAGLFAELVDQIIDYAWTPTTPEDKCLKQLVEATIQAIGCIKAYATALQLDEKYRGCGTLWIAAVAGVLCIVPILTCLYQASLLAYIYEWDDDPHHSAASHMSEEGVIGYGKELLGF